MTKTGRVPGPQRIRPDCLAGARLMLANAQIRADRGTAPEARAQGFGNKAEPLSLTPAPGLHHPVDDLVGLLGAQAQRPPAQAAALLEHRFQRAEGRPLCVLKK